MNSPNGEVFNILHNNINNQEKYLDELEKGINILGNNAKSINEELKTQNKMLDRVDDDINNSNNKINNILNKLLKVKDNSSTLQTIAILSVVLFVLVCFVIWS